MYRCLSCTQSFCDSVLGDAEAIHAVYLEVNVQLCRGFEVGYVGVHCSSRAADGLSDICRTEAGVFIVCASCCVSCFVFSQLSSVLYSQMSDIRNQMSEKKIKGL